MIPAIYAMYCNDENHNLPNNSVWLRQDGAALHYFRSVRDYLDEMLHIG